MIRFGDSYRLPGRVHVLYIITAIMVLSFWVTHTQMDANLVHQVGGMIPADFFFPEKLADSLPVFTGERGVVQVAELRAPVLITVFWSMFLHADLFHLLSNLLFFYFFGRNVAAKLGTWRFCSFFLSCGVAGALAETLYGLESTVPVIGASGAISGLLGAYLEWFPDNQFRLVIGSYRAKYREFLIPFKALFALWIINQLLMLVLGGGQTQNVAVLAHIGGFLCGLLISRGRGGGLGWRRKRFKVYPGGGPGPWGVD